jgi:predicted nucleic acid-binding protein
MHWHTPKTAGRCHSGLCSTDNENARWASTKPSSHYANLRLHLKSQGSPIPANDLWIAAMTKELQLPLLSNDHHFDLIPGLDRISF